ncbi:MAG: hypothetical protein U9P38_06200 [Campylobacterota bacterium]|nr:hypothetical protein [Campylobacterota bacterium]
MKLTKIIITLFIALFFSACGSDNPDYTLITDPINQQQASQEQPSTPSGVSSAIAPVDSSFADDIVFFNIRAIDEPEQQPVQEEQPSQSKARKADSKDNEDSDDRKDDAEEEEDADDKDEDDEDEDEDDEDDEDDSNDEEDDSNDDDSSSSSSSTTPSQTLDNYTTLGHITVTLQQKEYPFAVAGYNYGDKNMRPKLLDQLTGYHSLLVTGYRIVEDSLDVTYGSFVLEIDNIDIGRSGNYPIRNNILTNSATAPQMAYVTVDKVGDTTTITVIVDSFTLYDRTKTQIYGAQFNASFTLQQ